MAILPTRKVEIAFDAGVWTDISADVVSIHTRRGRNAESGAFETGTCSLTVRNDGRKYDPDHASGPYYGKLRPNRVVRVQATYNAITYDVFYGYLDRITQEPGGPNAAAATIDASDLFKLLNRQELPVSVYAAEVAADVPALWWRLDEPAGSTTTLDSTGNGWSGTAAGTVEFGASGLIVRDPGAAVAFAAAAGSNVSGVGPTLTNATRFAVEIWFRSDIAAGGSAQTILTLTNPVGNPVGGDLLSFSLAAANGWPTVTLLNSAGAGSTATYTTAFAINTTYHYVITYDSDQFVRLYVNGALAATSGASIPGAFTLGRFTVGSTDLNISPDGTLDEAAIYSTGSGTTVLSTARIAAHNTAGRTPWNGETPAARLGHIASLAAVVTTSFDAGSTTLQNTSLGGTALAYMQKVEETEIGRLFVLSNGTLRFVGRREASMGSYLVTKSTLVDADSGLGDEYRSVSAVVDEGAIVTRATVSRDGSVAITYTDAAAVAEFKTIDETHEGLLHDDDTYSLYYAQYLVNTKKAPTSRLGALQIELPSAPVTLYPDILGIELADRVQYKRKPQNTGAVTSQYMRVESIEHSTGAHYWTTLLQLSRYDQAGGVPVGYWDSALWDQAVWGL